jgi:hypothetical protein
MENILQERVELVGLGSSAVDRVKQGWRHGGGAFGRQGGRIVFIPQRATEAVVRIVLALERKQRTCARIGAVKLRVRRMQLVRQIISAAAGQRGVDQLAGPDADALFGIVARALLVIQHEGKRFALGPRHQRPRIGCGVADRNIDHVDLVLREHGSQLRHERQHSIVRHEIFLQHVGTAAAAHWLEFGRIVTRFEISPMDFFAEEQ